jgi:hypothetical protein
MSTVHLPTGAQRLDDYIALEDALQIVDDVRMDHIDQTKVTEARELIEHVRSDLPRNGVRYDRANAAIHNLLEIGHDRSPRANAELAMHEISELMAGLR